VTGQAARSIEVLLVEDNPGDVRLTKEAMRESKVLVNLSVATDGEEALAFLRKQGVHQGGTAPRSDSHGPQSSKEGWP
jgi:CheY-like chemotaxis protein